MGSFPDPEEGINMTPLVIILRLLLSAGVVTSFAGTPCFLLTVGLFASFYQYERIASVYRRTHSV